jgi:hypothetical protein
MIGFPSQIIVSLEFGRGFIKYFKKLILFAESPFS